MERKNTREKNKNRNMGLKKVIKIENFSDFDDIYIQKTSKNIKKYLVVLKFCTIFVNEEETKCMRLNGNPSSENLGCPTKKK